MSQVTHAEFEIMRDLCHPNIVRVFEFFDFSTVAGDVHILMELVEGPCLEHAVTRFGGRKAVTACQNGLTEAAAVGVGENGGDPKGLGGKGEGKETPNPLRMTEDEARPLFRQLVEALVYLKEKKITHRDVSLRNVLLSSFDPKRAQLKLADFNVAKKGETDGLMTPVGNPRFIAPEVTFSDYGTEVDMWSLGVCLHFMLTGVLPFECPKKKNLIRAIRKNNLCFDTKENPIWEGVTPEGIDLCRWCLTREIDRRATPQDALGHPWMEGIPIHPVVRDAMTARAAAGSVPDLRPYRLLLLPPEQESHKVRSRWRQREREEFQGKFVQPSPSPQRKGKGDCVTRRERGGSITGPSSSYESRSPSPLAWGLLLHRNGTLEGSRKDAPEGGNGDGFTSLLATERGETLQSQQPRLQLRPAQFFSDSPQRHHSCPSRLTSLKDCLSSSSGRSGFLVSGGLDEVDGRTF
uniref:Protein kinase domain-containing protein n=1 Tax=Chromera velia CCMP2878 TaxID=1169474 RepID=A0A0G4IFZ3_9ALVE|eukprot:Cvel_14142.t1-p1 / transcript=Cvel_14142.t1 / gene=Cvel_14142 / organism=Chromera_velia_CCMP2878 / gene_product=Probable serine/threonine-protein kinase fhkE, putative / transcript_product=Probable serine/threonine-protein kinase fhkE, putative / location=Cvel_scaffold996:41031-42764(+) / protein_length=463 / sequence_SO=supercontig / SO=protein_coding / is_pseudo=false